MRQMALLVTMLFSAASQVATAGSLKIVSWYAGSLSCSYGSGTYPNGPSRNVNIGYGAPWVFGAGAYGVPTIDWLKCGNAVARNMAITTNSEDHTIVIPGFPQRALNVLLYNYLPSAPNNNFAWMQALVAINFATYSDPGIMLNAVITADPKYDIYTAANYPNIFGANGFDVVETDTIMLPQILAGNYIRPWQGLDPAAFWPAATQAVTAAGSIWGVPQWLCSDFLFSRDPSTSSITTFAALNTYLQQQPTTVPRMVGTFNGHWRLVAVYLDAYADLYGFSALGNAYNMPPDPTAINNIAALTNFCLFNSANNCTNTYYYKQPDGTDAAVFGTDHADTYIGFSEQSFYIIGVEPSPSAPLYATQVAYGTLQQPLLFVDAFVANATTCAMGSLCANDAQNFATTINSPQVLDMITYSWDLQTGKAPRHLLPAALAFWSQPLVQNDGLYRQFRVLITQAQAFPNNITAAQEATIYQGVCNALKTASPGYVC
jgi:thiamine pyridinylase